MPLSGKGNKKIDFQNTISDVKFHTNQMLHSCPQNGLFTSEILSEIECLNELLMCPKHLIFPTKSNVH